MVGYDVAYAYKLAQDLRVDLEFVPFRYEHLSDDLQHSEYDIAMSATGVFVPRLESMLFTAPTHHLHTVFIVPDYRRDQYIDLESVVTRKGLRVGVLRGTFWEKIAKEKLPNAEVIIIDSYDEMLSPTLNLDAMLSSNEEGMPWVVAHPTYTTVDSQPTLYKTIYAYPVARDAERLVSFLNYWLYLKELRGFKKEQHEKWILGKTKTRPKRWSIMKNVLHWVD